MRRRSVFGNPVHSLRLGCRWSLVTSWGGVFSSLAGAIGCGGPGIANVLSLSSSVHFLAEGGERQLQSPTEAQKGSTDSTTCFFSVGQNRPFLPRLSERHFPDQAAFHPASRKFTPTPDDGAHPPDPANPSIVPHLLPPTHLPPPHLH